MLKRQLKVKIINGPNLNLQGKREVDIYGNKDFKSFIDELQREYPTIHIDYYQSNVEGEIINEIHKSDGNYNGIILNAGGYTHTSISISDAVKAVDTPVVEVHISNIMNREEYREKSLIAQNASGIISGFGLRSYELALHYFAR